MTGVQTCALPICIKVDVKWPESGITSWQFGDLPESLEVERGGHHYLLYPAIVDKQDSVGIELMDSLQSAQHAQIAGLRRLAALSNAKEVKYLERNFPAINSMCLIYATLGTCEALKQDLLGLVLSSSFFSKNKESTIRTEEQFLDCLENSTPLMSQAQIICKIVADILETYQAVSHHFKNDGATLLPASRDDIREQLDSLVSPDFLRDIPAEWLGHIPRYLQALDVRLKKLSAVPASDAEKLKQIRPLVDSYLRLKNQPNALSFEEELSRLKWMVEEFRVSLFAQTLKTSIPISVKRIEKQIALCS